MRVVTIFLAALAILCLVTGHFVERATASSPMLDERAVRALEKIADRLDRIQTAYVRSQQ